MNARRRLWSEDRAGASRVLAAGPMLDNHTLTIGFARRFTGYKRPSLIFRDPERLARILRAPGRQVQIVFAGKAHPADEPGKHMLQNIYRKALDPAFGGRVAFVEDYDLHVAHFLVQGCDVWLNNPRKPLEASGTSGMKACMNGVPQLSIGDGWWAEGYNGRNGWLIESHAPAEDENATDQADAESLYHLLEHEIVPAFYDRDEQGHSAAVGARGQGSHPIGGARLLDPADGEGLRASGCTCRPCGSPPRDRAGRLGVGSN